MLTLITIYFIIAVMAVIAYFVGMYVCDGNLYINDDVIYQVLFSFAFGPYGLLINLTALFVLIKAKSQSE